MKVSNMRDKLYDSPPLVVNPELAAVMGLNEAIVFQQIHYWLKTSKHSHKGRQWIYNSLEEWRTQFPFWSVDTIQRTLKSLTKQKIVLAEMLNKQNWDRTNWYTIDYDAYDKLYSKLQAITKASEKKRDELALRRRRRKSATS